jgi:hypothetical protein
VLKEIRARLREGNPCRVISTQLIEAGVDVDFPIVFRALAGLDSIAQASGRCNREGRLDVGRVVVFHPVKHGMPTKGWIKETAVEAKNCISKYGISEVLSLNCMKDYFERVHGIHDEQDGPRLRDQEGIVDMLTGNPPNFPYEDVAERFQFIDSAMVALVVPWRLPEQRSNPDDPIDPDVYQLIERLKYDPYPASILRNLQPYTVQVYRHELMEYTRQQLVYNIQGVWIVSDLSYYEKLAGLLSADDETDSTIYIF